MGLLIPEQLNPTVTLAPVNKPITCIRIVPEVVGPEFPTVILPARFLGVVPDVLSISAEAPPKETVTLAPAGTVAVNVMVSPTSSVYNAPPLSEKSPFALATYV